MRLRERGPKHVPNVSPTPEKKKRGDYTFGRRRRERGGEAEHIDQYYAGERDGEREYEIEKYIR